MKLISKFFFIIVFIFFNFVIFGQDIPQHISYTRIYDFLDEMASEGIFELNSVAKPYARTFITDKLLEAEAQSQLLNNKQHKELYFFLNEFALEQERLPDSKLNIWKNELSKASFIQPAFHYRDTFLRVRITPLVGLQVTRNKNGIIIKRWYGGELQAMIGNHLSIYGSLRDISFQGSLLSRPSYLNNYAGCEYKESTAGGDFSDSRGGIKYAWNWGSFGLVKENVVWGDNYHGSNILSGRAPSFPMLMLHLKPAKWFEMQYFHGWLVSNVLDSTRYYVDNLGTKQYRMANKFMAANLFTFNPVRNFNFSVGNSIVYSESNVQAAYFIPVAFYKSLDHSLTKGLSIENQNSQIFLNFSSRNIKHLHLFTSVYIDEVDFSRFKPSNPEKNPISYKVGASLSNFPVQSLSIIGEFTRTNIINYKHSIPVLTWASNGYNLGSYLGDNSQEIYFALRFKPIRGLDFSLSWIEAKHGNEYYYLRKPSAAIGTIISQPVLGDISWSNQTLEFNAQYEIFNNAYALFNLSLSNINEYDLTSTSIAGELRKTDSNYPDFTPAFLEGKNSTITLGFSMGF